MSARLSRIVHGRFSEVGQQKLTFRYHPDRVASPLSKRWVGSEFVRVDIPLRLGKLNACS